MLGVSLNSVSETDKAAGAEPLPAAPPVVVSRFSPQPATASAPAATSGQGEWSREAHHLTVSVPCMPAARWPSTGQ